jgi:hypothetical protein
MGTAEIAGVGNINPAPGIIGHGPREAVEVLSVSAHLKPPLDLSHREPVEGSDDDHEDQAIIDHKGVRSPIQRRCVVISYGMAD